MMCCTLKIKSTTEYVNNQGHQLLIQYNEENGDSHGYVIFLAYNFKIFSVIQFQNGVNLCGSLNKINIATENMFVC